MLFKRLYGVKSRSATSHAACIRMASVVNTVLDGRCVYAFPWKASKVPCSPVVCLEKPYNCKVRSIFEYTDYRRFLADFLEYKKALGAPWSQRFLQQKLGVKSSGYIANILSGKKNISDEQAVHLAAILGLAKREADYFLALIRFNQATTLEERNRHFRSLREYTLGQAAKLAPERHSLFKRWYHVALVELVQCRKAGVSPEQLVDALVPNPGLAAVREALSDLESWGFIRNVGDRYVRSEPTLTTGDDILSLAVANFQRETIDLAREAMDRFGLPERDISCLTLALSERSALKVREEVRAFRKRLLAISEQEPNPDRVTQINFQVYPLARCGDKPTK